MPMHIVNSLNFINKFFKSGRPCGLVIILIIHLKPDVFARIWRFDKIIVMEVNVEELFLKYRDAILLDHGIVWRYLAFVNTNLLI